ncbi:potassium channel family protein [Caproicibacterium sp. NSD3]
MNIVIMGGGKLGRQLALNMLERKSTVQIIEKDRLRSLRLANELDLEVISGNGTELEILKEARTSEADCFLAVSGSDQDNLVACQLAKQTFGVKKVIARANDPRNLTALRVLGIDIVVSSTEIITNMIEQEVNVSEMHLLTTLNRGRAAIVAMTLTDRSTINGTKLRDVELPNGSLIVSVLRDGQMIIPNGDLVFSSGDEIVAVCEGKSQKDLNRILSR